MTSSNRDSEESDIESRLHDHHDNDGHVADDLTPESADESDVALFSVPDMDCRSCAGELDFNIRELDGITVVNPEVRTGTLSVSYDSDRTTANAIAERVEKAGYEVTDSTASNTDAGTSPTDERESVWTSSQGVKTWIAGGLVMIGFLLKFFLTGQNILVAEIVGREFHIADIFFLIAIGFAGQGIFQNGYYSALDRSLDIDLLVSVAIGGAIVASLFIGEALYFETATLVFLFSVAELLERCSMDRTRNSLWELIDLP